MTPLVPGDRRGDWDTLLSGLERGDADPRVRARVEGLVRALLLFRAKAPAPPAPPLAWEEPVTRLAGVGPQGRDALAAQGIVAIADLAWTPPVAFEDLREPIGVADAVDRARAAAAAAAAFDPEVLGGEPPPRGDVRVVVAGEVDVAGVVPMRGRRAVRLVVRDADAPRSAPAIHVWWFFLAHGVLAAAPKGARVLLVGTLRANDGKPPRMVHPDLFEDAPGRRVVRARYPRFGVPQATLRKAIAATLDRAPLAALPDPVPADLARREGMPAAAPLVRAVHGAGGVLEQPPSAADLGAFRERLAWAEAFTRAWARLVADERGGDAKAVRLPEKAGVTARLVAELGFPLTRGQKAAVATIAKDLARPVPMRRLLLGDVGTGKTAVALAAVAQCVAAGKQAVVLAPTSLLAEQYMDAVAPLARATAARIALLVAGQKKDARRRAEDGLASGAIDVAVGTHALFTENVQFAHLALVVIDEQHRLGVAQRLALVGKGGRPHLLTLSATPIPRTLALALRGELATSTLDERPRGRPAPKTVTWPRARFDAVIERVRAACERGERVFFVAPRIGGDEPDEDDGAADGDDRSAGGAGAGEGDAPGAREAAGAVARAAQLAASLAPFEVALVHGGLPPAAKTAAMRAFRQGRAQVLVGTTVVEVGVDVPEATLMIVDGAEQFGLAQLHQLRGRVGRGERPGTCVLLHGEPLSDLARRRLDALCRLDKGADVARADLELRGAGDLGGTRQSGAEEELVYLDPAAPPPWLERIDADARALFASDRALARPEHRGLALATRRLGVAIAVREEAG